MSKRRQFTAEEFIEAIPNTGGIISTIAKRVGCEWHTAKRYIEEYSTVKQAYNNEKEATLDAAESVILKGIQSGDVQDAKWYLSRLGKDRGYSDKQEVEHSGDVSVNVKELSDDELRAIAES